MRVVLFQSIASLGLAGQVVEVKPGFYRNYLQPRGLALRETPGTLRLLASKKKKIEQILLREKSQAEEMCRQLNEISLQFTLKAGDGGRLFGSVTNRDVVASLEQKGMIVERHKVELPDAIKTVGKHTARIKLYPDVVAELAIVVDSEKKQQEEEEDNAPRRRRPAKAAAVADEAPQDSAPAPAADEASGAQESSPEAAPQA